MLWQVVEVENTISTRDMAHSEVWVEVDYISLDSWDHEYTMGDLIEDEAYIDINGVNVWTKDIDNHNPETIFGQVWLVQTKLSHWF